MNCGKANFDPLKCTDLFFEFLENATYEWFVFPQGEREELI